MKYTKSHEWIDESGSPITKVGITDYAQNELGDIVYVELPTVGSVLKRGEELAVLESTKAAADVYAPCSGVVVEVNESLKDHPEWVNSSPQEKGWIAVVELSNPNELKEMMSEADYLTMIGG